MIELHPLTVVINDKVETSGTERDILERTQMAVFVNLESTENQTVIRMRKAIVEIDRVDTWFEGLGVQYHHNFLTTAILKRVNRKALTDVTLLRISTILVFRNTLKVCIGRFPLSSPTTIGS